MVQNLPAAPTTGPGIRLPDHLAERVTFTTHDFFDRQPVVAGAYLFRQVLQAVSDKDAIKMLRALIPALRPGARIIINDSILPPPGAVARPEDETFRLMDMLLKTVGNASEREEDDWKSLFAMADPRFAWQGAWQSSGRLWFVEAIWEE